MTRYFNINRYERQKYGLISIYILLFDTNTTSDVFRFDLRPFLQGQTSITKLKSAYNLLIIGPRGCNVNPANRKSWAGNLLVWSDLTLVPSLKVN